MDCDLTDVRVRFFMPCMLHWQGASAVNVYPSLRAAFTASNTESNNIDIYFEAFSVGLLR